MKRFLLFAGFNYDGVRVGWHNYYGAFDTVPLALIDSFKTDFDWWQVVDSHTELIIKESKLDI